MTEAIIMSGPCQVCGCVNYAASFGGPTICPSCDCGFYGAPVVQRQGREIIALREEIAALRAQPAPLGEAVAFQSRVDPWLIECFGLEIARDVLERNHRFLEESLELVQANGCSAGEAHQLVDYVYGRDQGDINQEVGGVMVTLAALCLASGVDMHAAAETELERVWTKVEKIRAKHFAKPKFSPLPGYATVPPAPKAAADVRELPNWREVEMMRLIDLLRAQEGDSVTICCDNPDFNGQPNCLVICNGEWTGWEDRRFAQDTLLDALSAAMITYKRPKSSDGGVEGHAAIPSRSVHRDGPQTRDGGAVKGAGVEPGPSEAVLSNVRAAVIEALFEPRESDAIDNLEGALIDIKRLSEAGKPTDAVCIRTLERIQKQLVKALRILAQPAPDAGQPSGQRQEGE